eukprot:3056138-Rhodomonas_salina.1
MVATHPSGDSALTSHYIFCPSGAVRHPVRHSTRLARSGVSLHSLCCLATPTSQWKYLAVGTYPPTAPRRVP